MKVTIEKFYCDRCGKEMDEREYNIQGRYIDKLSPVHKVCSDCWIEYKKREQELLNWVNQDGNALACKKFEES